MKSGSPSGDDMMLMIGPFPPPVNGAALVTGRLADRLGEHLRIVRCDVSAGAMMHGLAYHALRLRRIWRAIGAVVSAPRGAKVYLSAAGGSGLVYTALLAGLARVMRRPVTVHHHSFAYINRRSILMTLLVRLAGRDALHLVLCPRMGERLKVLYAAVRTMPLSNAFLFDAAAALPARRGDLPPLRLGHLSNLSQEKGLEDVLAVQAQLRRNGAQTELLLAGPTVGAREDELIAAAVGTSSGHVHYLGPVYDDAKERFFAGIDVFLFPTRYVNEAEPLVVFEALASGVPVIAYDRGCIAEQLGVEGGKAVAASASFIDAACTSITAWSADHAALRQAQAGARRRIKALSSEAAGHFQELLTMLDPKKAHEDGNRYDG